MVWPKVVSEEMGRVVVHFEETAAGFDGRRDIGCRRAAELASAWNMELPLTEIERVVGGDF